MPSISIKPLVPSNPGPPKDPKSFWAPWPAIREPCTTRTTIGANSLTFEVCTRTPSVSFSDLTTLIRQRFGRFPTLYTPDQPIYTPALMNQSVSTSRRPAAFILPPHSTVADNSQHAHSLSALVALGLPCPITLPFRIRAQPQAYARGLHRLPHNPDQILAQGVEVSPIPELGREGFQGLSSIVLPTVEVPIYKALDATPQRSKEGCYNER